MDPILYWDLVRFVRHPLHFKHRVTFVSIVGVMVLFPVLTVDSRSIGALAKVSEGASNLAFALQSLAINLFVPAMLAGSICDDRRLGRLDLLLATPLARRRIVLDKFLVGVALSIFAMLALLPFTLLGPIMGGVEPTFVLKGEVAAVVETIFVAAVSLMISARSSNGSDALAKCYAFLFTLRYAAPHLESLISMISLGASHSELWAWALSISPASAAKTAWSPEPPSEGRPTFSLTLLIPLVVAGLALWLAVLFLDRAPASQKKAVRTKSRKSNEALLDSDPLVWRAIHLRVYDRTGTWMWMVMLLAITFAALVVAATIHFGMSFWAACLIFLVVFILNAAAPIQWLINERKSGWFSELQMTPLTMDDVLDASIAGTSHHLRPLWIVAGLAILVNNVVLFARDAKSGVVLLAVEFLLFWPTWLAYWSAIYQGFAAESFATGLVRALGGQLGRLMFTLPLGWMCLTFSTFAAEGIVSSSSGLLLAAAGFSPVLILVLLFVLGGSLLFFLFVKIHLVDADYHVGQARTALYALEKTANFGKKGGAAAWNDWVGVDRTGRKETLIDVFERRRK